MEAGLKPYDTEQMSGGQELMSGDIALLALGYGLKAMDITLKSISD